MKPVYTPAQADPVMRHINAAINRSAGQHLRAMRKTMAAQSMTSDPYLLHRTHHVDTERDPPADAAGVAIGHAALPIDFATTVAEELRHEREAQAQEVRRLRIRTWRIALAGLAMFWLAAGAYIFF